MGFFGVDPNSLMLWVIQYGYLALFLGAVIEGPIISILGGFLNSLGFFQLHYVYFILVLGDILGDTCWYLIGYFSRKAIIVRVLKKFEMTEEKLIGLDDFFKRHGGKSVFFSKFIAGAGSWTLISVGASKMNIKKFYKYSVTATVIKCAAYMAVGYFFGGMYLLINKWLDLTGTIILLIIVAIILITILKKFTSSQLKKAIKSTSLEKPKKKSKKK
jgi:membrane protein DedA with SNARE-associated domain